eukprot:10142265-Ditylum_brightwellii.AAC.1
MKDAVGFLREAYDKHMRHSMIKRGDGNGTSYAEIETDNISERFWQFHKVPESLKLSQSDSVDVSEMTDNVSISATSTKATSTFNMSLKFDAIKRTYLDTSSISGIFLHYHNKNLEQHYFDYSKTFTKEESKERTSLYQKMNTYHKVVAYILMFHTQMPADMPIDTIPLV